jgi:hypothetical protein
VVHGPPAFVPITESIAQVLQQYACTQWRCNPIMQATECGGLRGSTTAAYLANVGAEVCVLDKNTVCVRGVICTERSGHTRRER